MKITRERRNDAFCKLGDAYCAAVELLRDYPGLIGPVYELLKSITDLQRCVGSMEIDEQMEVER